MFGYGEGGGMIGSEECVLGGHSRADTGAEAADKGIAGGGGIDGGDAPGAGGVEHGIRITQYRAALSQGDQDVLTAPA